MNNENKQIKAIDTYYKGYKFRSRLEARWAVFFDALGIEWEYEKEGYEFEDGTKYLPDFWLPTFSGGMFVEVKPQDLTPEEMHKVELLVKCGYGVWLAIGLPSSKEHYVAGWDKIKGCVGLEDCMPNVDQACCENRMFWSLGCSGEEFIRGSDAEQYLDACNAARSARFEFNDKIN